ncbi:hypothetical protein ACFFX0_16145 [Citricoccus parietis]|uniref:Uncharacterized protein n=1 Tax=Citricoccus parietis TaxID=592307 RepID=A0ABV5G142_9MICC
MRAAARETSERGRSDLRIHHHPATPATTRAAREPTTCTQASVALVPSTSEVGKPATATAGET